MKKIQYQKPGLETYEYFAGAVAGSTGDGPGPGADTGCGTPGVDEA